MREYPSKEELRQLRERLDPHIHDGILSLHQGQPLYDEFYSFAYAHGFKGRDLLTYMGLKPESSQEREQRDLEYIRSKLLESVVNGSIPLPAKSELYQFIRGYVQRKHRGINSFIEELSAHLGIPIYHDVRADLLLAFEQVKDDKGRVSFNYEDQSYRRLHNFARINDVTVDEVARSLGYTWVAPSKVLEGHLEEIKEYLKEGKTYETIGSILGVSKQRISGFVAEHGLKHYRAKRKSARKNKN